MGTKLTGVWLDEERVGAALSTGEVIGTSEEACLRDDGGLGLARSWLKWISGCSEKAWAKTTGEWRSIAQDLLGGGAHNGNGYGGGV